MRAAAAGIGLAVVMLGVVATAGIGAPGSNNEAGAATPCPPPANDGFADSIVITSLPFSDSVCDDYASSEPGEPSCLGPGGTFWYTFTPSTSQVITLHATSIYSRIAVYTGDSLASLSALEPPVCDFGESQQFGAIAGETYHIQVQFSDSLQAETAYPPGLDFSLGLDVDSDGVDDCTTRIEGPSACVATPDQSLRLKIYLDVLPDYAYSLFAASVRSNGPESEHAANGQPWPGCQNGPLLHFEEGLDNLGCATYPPNSRSSYAGLMATFDYTCTQDGTLELLNGSGDTFLDGEAGRRFEAGIDKLSVSCNGVEPPVGGVALDALSGSGAFDAWWLAAIAGAAFVTLGGAAYARVGRTHGSAPTSARGDR